MTGGYLASWSATELTRQVQAGTLSALEVVEAVLAAIAAREASIKAWVHIDADGARRQARAADARRRAGLPLGPLHGTPFGVKDIFDVAGMPTQAGFAPYRDRIATVDSAAVARLRAAGAIPIGKTHTTQWALGDPAPTRNPWRHDRTPGGSSSGSAAAVGGGAIPLALGSQTAGSVLRPAGYCGAVGFKPTWSRVSLAGVLPLAWSLDHVGVMSRTVGDAELAFRALIGDGESPASTPNTPKLVMLEDFVARSQPDVGDHARSAARRLADAGAEVATATSPVDLDLFLAVQQVIMSSEIGAVHADSHRRHAADYGPRIRASIETGQLVDAHMYLKADRLRARIAAAIEGFFDATGADALLMPTASNLAPTPETTGDRSFQAPWSLLGLPAISLPTGWSQAGLPFATQLVGRRGHDLAVLAVARWAEAAVGVAW